MKQLPALAQPRLFALSALTLALLPMVASANQSLSPAGYGLTVGPVFNRNNLGAAAYNPANQMRMVADDENFRIGAFEFGMRYELGDMNDVAKARDQIRADIATAASAPPTVGNAENLAGTITNIYLPALNKGAKLSTQGRLSLAAPMLMRTQTRLPGVWSFNINAQAQVAGTFRGSDVAFVANVRSGSAAADVEVSVADLSTKVLSELETAVNNDDAQGQQAAMNKLLGIIQSSVDKANLQQVIDSAVGGNPVTAKFRARTASAFDFKLAEVNQISLGYAYDMTPHTPAGMRELLPNGKLDVGLRLNAYQANLYRQLMALMDEQGNANTVDFSSDANFHASKFVMGVDLGVLWSDEHYQFGVSFYNLNSPRFVYPSPVSDANPANVFAANQLASKGLITLNDEVVLKPHAVLEASVFSANKRWLLQGSYAANETTDFVGNPQKIATVSASFNAERMDGWYALIPSLRVGLRQNLVGSKLSTVGLGMTWGVLNVDMNVSSQKVQADGQSVPRSAGFAISIAERF